MAKVANGLVNLLLVLALTAGTSRASTALNLSTASNSRATDSNSTKASTALNPTTEESSSTQAEYVEAQCKLNKKPDACLKIVQPYAEQINGSFYRLINVALFNSVGILKETEQILKQIVHETMFTDQQQAVQTCADSIESAGTSLDSASIILNKIDENITRTELVKSVGKNVVDEVNQAGKNMAVCTSLQAKVDTRKLGNRTDFLNDSLDTVEVLNSLLST